MTLEAFSLERVGGKWLGLEEEGRGGGGAAPPPHPDVLEDLARPALTHGDRVGRVETAANQLTRFRLFERTGADRVYHHRHADLFREHDLAQKEAGFRVEEDSSAAEDQQVEALDLG